MVKNAGKNVRYNEELPQAALAALEFQDEKSYIELFHPEQGKWLRNRAGLHPVPSLEKSAGNRPEVATSILAFGLDAVTKKPFEFVILGTLQQKVSSIDLPLKDSESQFFTVRFKYKDETVEKQLESDNNSVILSKEAMFTDKSGHLLDFASISNIEIVYHDGQTQNVSPFHPVFPEETKINAEIEMLIKNHKGSNPELIDRVLKHIEQYYGIPNKQNVRQWLATNFNIQ